MKHVVVIESNLSGILALDTAKKMGNRVTFITSKAQRHLYSSHLDLAKIEETLDSIINVNNSFDVKEICDVIRDINYKNKIDGIFTVLDHCVIPVSHAAQELGLPRNSIESLETARIKSRARKIISDYGLPSIAYNTAISMVDFENKLAGFTFPIVLKPVSGCGKILTSIVSTKLEAIEFGKHFFSSILNSTDHMMNSVGNELLMEEYMIGRMFSVEVGVSNGQCNVFALGERRRAKHNEILEMGTTQPPALSVQENSSIEEYTKNIIRICGFSVGFFHVEIMLTDTGPKLIECNPRLMGGSLPLLYNYSYNSNIYERLIEAHLGDDFSIVPKSPSRPCASRMLGATNDGRVNDSFDLSWVEGFKPFELQLNLNIKQGSQVKKLNTNFDYLGSYRVRCNSAQECANVTDQILICVANTLGIELVE